jgi:hypothetical protein
MNAFDFDLDEIQAELNRHKKKLGRGLIKQLMKYAEKLANGWSIPIDIFEGAFDLIEEPLTYASREELTLVLLLAAEIVRTS